MPQHGFALFEQGGDFGWLEAQHLAFDVPRQQEGHARAEQQRHARGAGQLAQMAGQ